MELIEKELKILEAYYSGTLTDSIQKTALEYRLNTDNAFKKAALEWHLKKKGLETIRNTSRREFLLKIDSKMPEIERPKPILVYLRLLKIAAAAAVLGVLAWVTIPMFSTPKPAFAAHFKPFPADEKRKGTEGERARLQAFEAYEKANYCVAMPHFQKAFDLQNDTLLRFYYGVSAVGCGDFVAAQPVLESLQTSQVVPTEHLPYYLGLTYANIGQYAKARSAFETAQQKSELFKQNASAALQELRNKENLKK